MAVNSGCRHDPSAHRSGAGESDDVEVRVAGQRGTDVRARTGDDVERSVRQAGFRRQAS